MPKACVATRHVVSPLDRAKSRAIFFKLVVLIGCIKPFTATCCAMIPAPRHSRKPMKKAPSSPVKPASPRTTIAVPETSAPPPTTTQTASSPTKPVSEKKPFTHFAILLAVLSAYLYLVGYLYQSGYLEAVGIDPDLYSRSVDGYVTKAFFPIMLVVTKVLPHFSKIYELIFAVVALSLACFFIIFIVLKRVDKSPRLSTRLTKFANGIESPFGKGIAFFLVAWLTIAAIPTVFLLVLALFVLPAHNLGNRAAHEDIAAFIANGKCTDKPVEKHTTLPCVELKTDNGSKALAQGLLLVSSDKAVAIYDPVTAIARSFVLDKGMNLERKYIAPSVKP